MRYPTALFAAAIVLAACGAPDPAAVPGAGATPGGGLSVEEALAYTGGGPIQVAGALIVVDGRARLCAAILESFPPQCGEPALVLEQLDLGEVPGLMSESGVSWSDAEMSFVGEIANGVLTVSDVLH